MSFFADKVKRQEGLIGTWVKTPSPVVCEVLALTKMDMVCLDAEHAPFGRSEMDSCVAMLRAKAMPVLVRVPSAEPSHILNALDCGATGIVAPHICNADQARNLVKACHFGAGGRGYAGSTRAAGFTTSPMGDNLHNAKCDTVVVAQIEDLDALDNLDEIASVEGVDCLFVGRIDLTVAMGAKSPLEDGVMTAVERICAAGKKAGKPVGMFTPFIDEIPRWKAAGASLFLLDSDQGFMLKGANTMTDTFRESWNS